MARIRTIKPEFWNHPKVGRVSRDARLLFLGMLNEADDEGRLRYGAKRLAGVIFPADDDVGSPQIESWCDELKRVGLVERYEVDGAELLLVIGFTEHQKVSHPSPSRLPSPPVPLANPPEHFASPPESLVPDQGTGNGTGNRDQGGAQRTRAQPIPDEFLVSDEMVEWVERECPMVKWQWQTEKFVDWAKSASGRNTVKKDWVRAWRNWMRSEQEKTRT